MTTIEIKTTMDHIITASIQAHGLRIRNAISKVGRFILHLLILNLTAVLLAMLSGIVFISLLYLLENLFPIA